MCTVLFIFLNSTFDWISRLLKSHLKQKIDSEVRSHAAVPLCPCSWVGYEKEGYRGNQYLLEEGEYQDWRVWGGCDAELRSVRVIKAVRVFLLYWFFWGFFCCLDIALYLFINLGHSTDFINPQDLIDPMMVMFETPEEEQEGVQEDKSFEVTEAIPDVELFEYKTSTRTIHVVSGAWVQDRLCFPFLCLCASLLLQWLSPNSPCVHRWVAYSHVDFSGNQYILEKGFYNNCADWGSQDNRICSVQPILLVRNPQIKL